MKSLFPSAHDELTGARSDNYMYPSAPIPTIPPGAVPNFSSELIPAQLAVLGAATLIVIPPTLPVQTASFQYLAAL